MHTRNARSIAGAIIAVVIAASAATAQGYRDRGDPWADLGCTEVTRRGNADRIKVGAQDGYFKAVRLQVFNHDVFIERLKVTYGDGEPDLLAVNADLADGPPTAPVALKDWVRAIDNIEIVARKTEAGRGPSRVCVQGLRASQAEVQRSRGQSIRTRGRDQYRDQPGNLNDGDWRQLGCERVGFVNDRDVIPVGREAGYFQALRFGVTGNSIVMRGLTVVYGDGEKDRLPVSHSVRDGEQSPAIALNIAGGRRIIDHIELEYGSKPTKPVEATLCLFGHH